MADETGAEGELRSLVRGARYVLWDFDGPICRLFAGWPAPEIALRLARWLETQGLHGVLTEEELRRLDPHGVVARLGLEQPGSDLVLEMEKRLTEQELQAVPRAWPTPWADPLIRTWWAMGVRLAVTTNNSPQAVRSYLDGRSLTGCFEPHIYGRTQNMTLLKPDPYCVNRALNAMGAAPGAALMIGDTPTDLAAATAAGVSFLGYARNEEKRNMLLAAGARHVVGSLAPLLGMLRERG
ncbi:HAD family hydrolase [Streptomyces sp. NPDC050095]|uniref:HAD family hydrolase n=1 Tax=unclassified Streptomyces TaxID=2593676 RepID=UPI003412E291